MQHNANNASCIRSEYNLAKIKSMFKDRTAPGKNSSLGRINIPNAIYIYFFYYGVNKTKSLKMYLWKVGI